MTAKPDPRRLPVTWLNTIWLNFFLESLGLKILSQVTNAIGGVSYISFSCHFCIPVSYFSFGATNCLIITGNIQGIQTLDFKVEFDFFMLTLNFYVFNLGMTYTVFCVDSIENDQIALKLKQQKMLAEIQSKRINCLLRVKLKSKSIL